MHSRLTIHASRAARQARSRDARAVPLAGGSAGQRSPEDGESATFFTRRPRISPAVQFNVGTVRPHPQQLGVVPEEIERDPAQMDTRRKRRAPFDDSDATARPACWMASARARAGAMAAFT